MEEEVVLVDAKDNEVGRAPKLAAHRAGLLHRAISVFLTNSAGELLLQRRADGKYHSPSLWSNACCTHPRPGEQPHAAALRRLEEELGIRAELAYLTSFIYKAELGNGLWEHELDHLFVGRTDELPQPDPAEVAEWRWASAAELDEELKAAPETFTAWFPLALARLREQPPA